MSIAVIQMVSQDDVTANLAAARRLLEQAAEGGARLAVLPENFAAMGRRDLAELGRAEARGNGSILSWLNLADTPVGRLGLTVCYDLRFPELYTALREAGAELITAPSAFTAVTGAAHWQVLVRARAIETQCYLLAAGQGGVHPRGRETFGHSAIVDPWGRVLAERPQGEAVLLAARDAAEQADIRRRMPVVAHRRFFPPAEPRPARTE